LIGPSEVVEAASGAPPLLLELLHPTAVMSSTGPNAIAIAPRPMGRS
jgi:hypothetical protein